MVLWSVEQISTACSAKNYAQLQTNLVSEKEVVGIQAHPRKYSGGFLEGQKNAWCCESEKLVDHSSAGVVWMRDWK